MPAPDPQFRELITAVLLYGVMPLWLAASFADWLCHRRSRIEATSGWRESALHALMLAEIGVPLLLAAFFEINALVVAVMLAGFLLHEATVYADLRYSSARRDIPPVEQMVHSFLELLPLLAGVLVLLPNAPAALSLFGVGTQPADFGLRWQPPAVPAATLAVVALAIGLLVALPYAEELWRCLRAARLSASASRAR